MAKFFMVYSPTSPKPPTRKMTEEQAKVVAQKMAEKNPGDTFFVVHATHSAYVPKPVLQFEEL